MSEQRITIEPGVHPRDDANGDAASVTALHGHTRPPVDERARARLLTGQRRTTAWEGSLVRQTVAIDLVAIVAAQILAWNLRSSRVADVVSVFDHHVSYLALAIVGLPIWLGVLALNHAYDRSTLGSSTDEYASVMRAVLVLFTLVCAAAFLGGMPISRALFAVFFPLLLAFALTGRLIVRKRLHRRRARGDDLRRVVLVSDASSATNVARHFDRSPHAGYKAVAAYVHGDDGAIAGTSIPVLGTPDDLIDDLDDLTIDAVALNGVHLFETESLRTLAWKLHDTGIRLLMAPDLAEIAGPRIVSRPAAGLPLLLVDEPQISGWAQRFKAVTERTVAFVACIVLAPFLIGIAIAVRWSSKGPVLFRQTRVTRRGEEFSMLKFRSMVVGADARIAELSDANEHDGVLFKIHDDPRVTPVGRFLRKYSLDELPQLWNVVRGDMALVGPRPPLPSEVERYIGATTRRLMVKSGITGLWQVSGRSDLSWEETIRLDLYYVENWSPLLDLAILAKTVKAVAAGRGAY